MIVIPSIDLYGGKAVKLVRGREDTGLQIREDPETLAVKWSSKGAPRIHVVDVEGAIRGEPRNMEVLRRIAAQTDVPIQYGGGLRSLRDCLSALSNGAEWIIVGTMAIKDRRFIEELLDHVEPSKVIVSIDVRDGRVAVDGWKGSTGLDPALVAARLDRLDLHAYLYTCIESEGALQGIDVEGVSRIMRSCSTPIIYSGGVSSPKDLVTLREMGVYGVVIGMALYSGLLELERAIEVAR